MPVTPMLDASELFDPSGTSAPRLENMSGREKTTKPLTQRAYEQLERALKKLSSGPSHTLTPQKIDLKLGLLLERSKLPRAIAVKMADLTEAYYHQLWALLESANTVESDKDEPHGPELEGVFEKSRDTARRFQEAMDGIELAFAELREESNKAVVEAAKAISAMNSDTPTKMMLMQALLKKYVIDVDAVRNEDGTISFQKIKAKHILLPLMKGQNVYRNKKSTFEHLLSFGTKVNKSLNLKNQADTMNGTRIEMLHQVQPKFETSVFSDHAGFVARFSCPKTDWPKLYVYYHSLEHGQQHTSTRTGWNYGSIGGLELTTPRSGFNGENKGTLKVNEPRNAFLSNLNGLLNNIIEVAQKEQANVLLVVGECTETIHEGILDLILPRVQDPLNWQNLPRAPLSQVNVHGTRTQAKGFDLKVVNASKSEYDSEGERTRGQGVHALVGYLFLNTANKEPGVKVEPSLLSIQKKSGKKKKLVDVRQNIITVKYGPKDELHAFSHLLNGEEDDLAVELGKCNYLTVGGDLNNLSSGTALVETVDRTGSHMSMGSNSTVSKMYDKIVLL